MERIQEQEEQIISAKQFILLDNMNLILLSLLVLLFSIVLCVKEKNINILMFAVLLFFASFFAIFFQYKKIQSGIIKKEKAKIKKIEEDFMSIFSFSLNPLNKKNKVKNIVIETKDIPNSLSLINFNSSTVQVPKNIKVGDTVICYLRTYTYGEKEFKEIIRIEKYIANQQTI